MGEFSELTLFAKKIALQAGALLKKGFGSIYKISTKEGIHNIVTEYDYLSEKTIIQAILQKYPTHTVLSEESGLLEKKKEITWIVDPLDGTVNFAHNIPFFSVSICIAKKNQAIGGVVYNPMLDEIFIAEKGKGAFYNNQEIHVSTTKLLEESILATGFPYNVKDDPLHCIEKLAQVLHHGVPIRRMGSAALDLCYLAAGRFDGFWELGLNPWDHAAANLILLEAGGKVSNWKNQEFTIFSKDPIIATNGHIHQQLHQALS